MKGRKGLLEILREKGYRLTPQRMIVVEAIEASDDHISAEEICDKARAKYPYINMSTVYRTLELLVEQGLVTETDLGGGRSLYHPTMKAQHHHLVCRKCAKVKDIDASVFQRLKDELRSQYGFDADLEHIGIFGTCEDCHD
ncbi:MAG: hypothetical protein A2Y91_06750 [Chloroflexi bacterium RBG_13_54_8]|nr:MAG: hypothetical protein A2Y91_06750 [Chloroflexi bacterium RBG_13_54_8]